MEDPFQRVPKPAEICYLTELGHRSIHHGYANLTEVNSALGIPGALGLPVVYDHLKTMNYLYFDGHAESLQVPPHSLHRRVDSGVFHTGVPWASQGVSGFRNRFHGGGCP